ncbi:ATP/GTP-binding protein [Dyadobacter sp. CY323]|uniref:AAA family ATPase n=1 Tax=Dyadobacter sp. CY323 TaxID=2907302 RepID=UPI001F2C3907|nr:AAA family ATPase [Dyadobacter sp. CY323]MCE6988628.1 AAA family ATPase [Dyadobacter sp. CY323]
MAKFIDNILIENFKSLKFCDIQGCKRINLFIGRPNVGKSNILEALSLFSIPYLKENKSKKLSTLIRMENEGELFYDGNTNLDVRIKTNIGECLMFYNPKEGLTSRIDFRDNVFDDIKIDSKLIVKGISNYDYFEPPIKRYNFKHDIQYRKSHSKYLIPPFGYNLLSIIEDYDTLKKDVLDLFSEYKLKVAFDKASQSIKIIRPHDDDIFLIPYNSIADTLQRIIFYKAAIESNSDSILLFEEPEAHSFPPYMTHITQEMIYKSDCQFFVATHSPYILNDLLENGREELAVFVVHYDQFETKLKKLESKELHDIFQHGVDLFTNSESFI